MHANGPQQVCVRPAQALARLRLGVRSMLWPGYDGFNFAENGGGSVVSSSVVQFSTQYR